MYYPLGCQGEEVISDDLLVLKGTLDWFTSWTVCEIVPVHKQSGHIRISSFLELVDLRLRNQFKLKKSQKFIDLDLPKTTANGR